MKVKSAKKESCRLNRQRVIRHASGGSWVLWSLLVLFQNEPLPLQAEEKLVESGKKISIRSSQCDLQVQGWENNTLQARAIQKKTGRELPVRFKEDPATPGIIQVSLDSSAGNEDASLEVKLPRTALDSAESASGDLVLRNLGGGVRVKTSSGDVLAEGIGELVASTGSGDVEVKEAGGAVAIVTASGDVGIHGALSANVTSKSGDVKLADLKGGATVQVTSGDVVVIGIGADLSLSTQSGDVEVENVKGTVHANLTSADLKMHRVGKDVHIIAVNGDLTLGCIGGRLEVNSVSGSIAVQGYQGDVDISTVSGDAKAEGLVRAGGRYRLKSNSGNVTLIVPGNTAGFTATLSSYSGSAETDFPLTLEPALQRGSIARRLSGKYGDGQAQITLDCFGGQVQLKKGAAGDAGDCRF
jgi:DUF4097 and DUF4098 domain-containing protein YvlB